MNPPRKRLTVRRTLLGSLAVLYVIGVVLIFADFFRGKDIWLAKELLTPILRAAIMLLAIVAGWVAGEIVWRVTRRLLASRILEALLVLAAFIAAAAFTGQWIAERWEEPVVQALARERYIRQRPVSAWVAQMDSPDPFRRGEALRELTSANDPAALPVLIRALNDPDKEARLRAVRSLDEKGPSAADAVPPLVGLLDTLGEADYEMRRLVISALGRIGPAAGAARPALSRLITDPQASQRDIARALGKIGPADEVAPVFVKAITQGRFMGSDRDDLAWALSDLGPGVVPYLIELIRTGSAFGRNVALNALGDLKAAGRDAAPTLRGLLKDPDPAQRVLAAGTLWEVTGATDESLPILIEGARYKGERAYPIQEAAVVYLKLMGAPARSAVPVLLEILPNRESFLGEYIVDALAAIDRDNPEVIAALCKAVTDKNIDTQVASIGVVGQIGPPASAAVPALVEMLQNDNLLMRVNAAQALVSIDPAQHPAIVAALRKLMEDSKFDRQTSAITLLAKIGSPEAIATIPIALKDRDRYVRSRAAEQLAKLGPAAKPVLPELIAALGDEDHSVQQHAAEALGAIGPDAHDAVPALIRCSKDDHLDSGRACNKALAVIAPGTAWWLRWRPWLIASGIALLIAVILEGVARYARRQEARRPRPAPAPNPFDDEGRIVSS